MPFNFPNNPTVSQSQNGRSYTWNGKVWNLTPDFGASVSTNTIGAGLTYSTERGESDTVFTFTAGTNNLLIEQHIRS